jgi:2-hydroxychromene-2-carboxylate isomerase
MANQPDLTADLYFSFRSPYSYLAVGRYRAMMEEWAVDIALRPVYPLAIRQPDFFERNHPNWLRYMMTDVIRLAQFHNIPFGPPRPDPIVQDKATRKIAEDQPYIRRITRLGQAAAKRAGLDLAELETVEAVETLDAEIAANQDALEAAGHWGVPTVVFDGEPFFGQDRIDMLLWRMQQKGLSKR